MDLIKQKIRTVPDFPQKGILFRDVTSLIDHADGFRLCIDNFAKRYQEHGIDAIVGIDSRGFIFASALAYLLNTGLVLARKSGKLPAQTISETYALEYGHAALEIHIDAIRNGQRVLIVDDLIATGGTAMAAINLVKKLGGHVVEVAAVIDLPDLQGSQKIRKQGIDVYTQTEFDGH